MQKIKTPKVKPIYPSEGALHEACIQWFYAQYGNTGAVIHHSPNENPKGNKATLIRYNVVMKSLGRLTGFPDLIIFYKERVLLVELKTIIGRLSEHQQALFPKIQSQGFPVHIIRTFEEFQALTNNFIQKYYAKKEDLKTNLP